MYGCVSSFVNSRGYTEWRHCLHHVNGIWKRLWYYYNSFHVRVFCRCHTQMLVHILYCYIDMPVCWIWLLFLGSMQIKLKIEENSLHICMCLYILNSTFKNNYIPIILRVTLIAVGIFPSDLFSFELQKGIQLW